MKKRYKQLLSVMLAIILLALSVSAAGAVSAQGESGNDDLVDGSWISAWSTSPVDAGISVKYFEKLGVPVVNQTSRLSIEPTMSGKYVRLVFSNEFGVLPLHIGECVVASSKADKRSVDTKTSQKVLFGGKGRVKIPAGERVVSDPVRIDVTAGENISVSTYYSGLNIMRTVGLIGAHSYFAFGNRVKSPKFTSFELALHVDSGAYEIIPALMEVDVLSDDPRAQTCVIFGDSTVSNEAPRYFAKILRESGIENVAVTQEAIKGNRLVADGVGTFSKVVGQSALKRFERDVLEQAGVTKVIVKIGINDVVHPYCKSKQGLLTPVSLEEMTNGYKALVEMAHEKGIMIYFCELTPWKGYTRNLLNNGDDINWTPEIDQLRLDINDWFASDDNPADGYIELSQLENENDRYEILKTYTTDGIHYTDEGTMTLAHLLPTDLF